MAFSDNLSSIEQYLLPDNWFSETLPKPNPYTPQTGSGSDPDPAPSKRPAPPASGRIGKRKPRASKKNPTTYIAADASNFRHMVQQVTGVKFPDSPQIQSVTQHILKPEPQRFEPRMQGCLPTLDTSAFLLGFAGNNGGSAAGLGFDSFACFPTLDSWKAL